MDVPNGAATVRERLPHEKGLVPQYGEAPYATGDDIVVVDLEALIRAKRAAGRPKDLEAIAELEALRGRRGRHTGIPE
jgi:hypothetical protein